MKRRILTPAQKHAVARELRAGRLSEDEALLKYGIGETALVCPRQPASSAGCAGPQRAAPTRQLRFSHAELSP